MGLKSRRRNKKATQKNVLSVKVQSQQTRRERLRWLRSVVALAVALVALERRACEPGEPPVTVEVRRA